MSRLVMFDFLMQMFTLCCLVLGDQHVPGGKTGVTAGPESVSLPPPTGMIMGKNFVKLGDHQL